MTSLAELGDRVVERTVELAQVPAPPLEEGERAAIVERWWHADGLAEVARDATGNVWGRLRPGDGPATVVCAHLDTVFDRDVAHTVVRRGGRLHGPGVGDDTVAVAALSSLRHLLPDDAGAPVWALATVGEEGLGNLAGIRAALAAPPARLGAVVAVEGNYLGRVCTVGVGSTRWRVTVGGPGGHAWERADAPSAVHAAAGMVHGIATAPRPAGARCAVNVGLLRGGEAINARARGASFDVDLRADDPEALAALGRSARAAIDAHADGVTVDVQDLGTRPAGRIADDHPLVRCAVAALRDAGVDPVLTAASTDANAAHAAGLPAVTVGVTTGAGEHTPQEWIDLPPLPTGLSALADTLRRFHQEREP
jgi:acetylornithine deacetylase/succinyl-diaminopimelate desuccinylase-like protein